MRKSMEWKKRVAAVAGGILLAGAVVWCSSETTSAATVSKKLGSGKISTSDGKLSVNKKSKVVSLKKSGTYQLSGKIGAYQIVTNTSDLKIKLILSNVVCTNKKTACIYNSKKSTSLTVQTVKGTTSRFTGPAKFTLAAGRSTPNAVIFSDGDLQLGGSGKLVVKDTSDNGDAIGGKKKITLSSGTVDAASKAAALHSDDILIKGGSLTAVSADTAVKASQVLTIEGGTCQITAVDKGLQGKAGVVIRKGTIRIKTSKSNDARFEDFRGISAGVSGANGKKAVAGSILINGGDITIQSYGDCIHAANNVTISGGNFSLTSTADDGIQAKLTLTITGNPKFTIHAEGKKVKGGTKNIAPSIKY